MVNGWYGCGWCGGLGAGLGLGLALGAGGGAGASYSLSLSVSTGTCRLRCLRGFTGSASDSVSDCCTTIFLRGTFT